MTGSSFDLSTEGMRGCPAEVFPRLGCVNRWAYYEARWVFNKFLKLVHTFDDHLKTKQKHNYWSFLDVLPRPVSQGGVSGCVTITSILQIHCLVGAHTDVVSGSPGS